MPASACHLYFQLGMYADDDGFVNPRKIMRMLGSSEDDLKILIAKRFVLPFQSGVVVVKHWKINNLVRKDWYRPSQYIEEKSLLFIKENGSYTDTATNGKPLVNDSLTVRTRRLGQVSIENTTAIADSSIRIEKTDSEGNVKEKTAKDGAVAKYELLLQWAEARRGSKFVNRTKQYAALKKARLIGISMSKLKERWADCENETWRDGFDWTSVVSSFDKKA